MTATNTHTHRWRIAEPNGPYSEGVCRECGATRMFGNSEESVGVPVRFADEVKRPPTRRRSRKRRA